MPRPVMKSGAGTLTCESNQSAFSCIDFGTETVAMAYGYFDACARVSYWNLYPPQMTTKATTRETTNLPMPSVMRPVHGELCTVHSHRTKTITTALTGKNTTNENFVR